MSGGLLPLPEHGVDISVVREECRIIRSRAREGEVLGIGKPSWSVPITIVVKVDGVMDTEGHGCANTIENLFKVPERLCGERRLDLLGRNPVAKGFAVLLVWIAIFPECKVAGEVVRLGKIDEKVGKGAIVDFVSRSASHGLVGNSSVGAKASLGLGEEGRGKEVFVVHGVVPVRGRTRISALLTKGDFTEPDEPTVPHWERGSSVETEPVVLVDVDKGIVHLIRDGRNAIVWLGLKALCCLDVRPLLRLGEFTPFLADGHAWASREERTLLRSGTRLDESSALEVLGEGSVCSLLDGFVVEEGNEFLSRRILTSDVVCTRRRVSDHRSGESRKERECREEREHGCHRVSAGKEQLMAWEDSCWSKGREQEVEVRTEGEKPGVYICAWEPEREKESSWLGGLRSI